jgi:hypothetical protein
MDTDEMMRRRKSVRYTLLTYSIVVLVFSIILAGGIAAGLWFFIKYSRDYYNIISSGQDDLCNFYTCSESSECGNYPKITFPDGTEKCAFS